MSVWLELLTTHTHLENDEGPKLEFLQNCFKYVFKCISSLYKIKITESPFFAFLRLTLYLYKFMCFKFLSRLFVK